MSFFTQQKSSFFESQEQTTQNLFNTQDFHNSASDTQLSDSQKPGSSSQQSDDMDSQLQSIFAKETNNQRPAHLFSQTQNKFNEKDLSSIERNSQLSFDSYENSWFASPINKRRAYGASPGSIAPGLASQSVSQVSASSFGVESSGNSLNNNYQSQRDQPHSTHQVFEDSDSSEFHTPAITSNSFLTPVQQPTKHQVNQESIFSSQHDFSKSQNDGDLRTPPPSQEYSQSYSPTSEPASSQFELNGFNSQKPSSQSQVFLDTQASASLSQHLASSHDKSFGFKSQMPPSQQQPSQASALSKPMDDDFDIENTVPSSVRELLSEVKKNHSDAVFTWLMASQFCQDAFPINAYSNIKLSLLLSLASMSANSQPLHIAAIGQETSHANIIMKSIGKFAKRFVTSTIPDFEGSNNPREKEVTAGPLLLAKTGVFFVGEWLRLPKNCETKLMRFIETGRVTMEKVQKQAPLECAVWAFWSSSNNLKKDASTVNQFIR